LTLNATGIDAKAHGRRRRHVDAASCIDGPRRRPPCTKRLAAATIPTLLAAVLVAGCAGAPPAGTPEREAWIKQKQAEAAAIEENGRVGDSLRWFRSNTP
jgi:hypothetical protein